MRSPGDLTFAADIKLDFITDSTDSMKDSSGFFAHVYSEGSRESVRIENFTIFEKSGFSISFTRLRILMKHVEWILRLNHKLFFSSIYLIGILNVLKLIAKVFQKSQSAQT